MATKYSVRRAAKISTGQYENTDVSIEITEDGIEGLAESEHLDGLIKRCDDAIKRKVDEIEFGQIKSKSKAGRFGV